jgi:outer membrane lipopolysaccharide assembly protein LptE/RlpB
LFKRGTNIGLIIICTVLAAACGYRFSGQGGFPRGVQHIFIEVFENRTSKTGIERIVTNQVIFEFTRQREASLASNVGKADAVLKGVVSRIRTKTVARVGTELASQREVFMSVDLKLVKPDSGQVLWAANDISDRQIYDVVQDSSIATDQNETNAITVLSERMSERIFNQLTNDF